MRKALPGVGYFLRDRGESCLVMGINRCGAFITPEHGLTDPGKGTLISKILINVIHKAIACDFI